MARNETENLGSIEYTTCKEACDERNCNDQPAVIAGNNCYVCSLTMDQLGNMVGMGDMSCLNNDINDTYIWDCGKESVCQTHMEVQWLPLGNQHMTFERKCGRAEMPEGECITGSSNAWIYKDCWESCDGNLCNDNMNIEHNFAPTDGHQPIEECFSCTFEELGAEWMPEVDFENCKEAPNESTKMACPNWAKVGCFVADGVQKNDDGEVF